MKENNGKGIQTTMPEGEISNEFKSDVKTYYAIEVYHTF